MLSAGEKQDLKKDLVARLTAAIKEGLEKSSSVSTALPVIMVSSLFWRRKKEEKEEMKADD